MSYDEAYNLQVVRHLVEHGAYATDGALYDGSPRLFDALISTGPTLVLPAAAITALLGDHLWVARLAPTIGFLLLLVCAALVGRRRGGSWSALASVAAVLAVDVGATWTGSAIYGTGALLGEFTCAALVLCACLRLGSPRAAGLLIGLAVLTKLLSLLVLPAFLLVLVLATRGGRGGKWDAAVRFTAWFALPCVAWNVIRWAVLGTELFKVRSVEFVSFFLDAGSGLGGRAGSSIGTRLGAIGDLVEPGTGSAPLVGLLLICAATATLVAVARRARFEPPERWVTAAVPLASALTIFTWWLFVSEGSFTRYLLLPVYSVLVVCAAEVTRVLGVMATRRRHLVSGLAMAALLAAAANTSIAAWWPPGPSLSEQRRVATAVRESGADHIVAEANSWVQHPDVSYLSHVPAAPPAVRGGVLVDWNAGTPVAVRCGDVLAQGRGWVVCRRP